MPVLTPLRRAVVVAVALALAGCTDGADGTDPAPSGPPPPAAFDCEAVAAAAAELDARGPAELDRLALGADDPQALTVTVVAAGTGAPAYWAAVQQALTPDAPASVAADVGTVHDYWAALAPRLDAITVADADPATVRAAGDQLAALAQQAPDDALAPAQERVDDALRATCG